MLFISLSAVVVIVYCETADFLIWLDLSRFDAAPLIAFTATKEMNYETNPNGQIP